MNIVQAFPSADVLLLLEPEELGAVIVGMLHVRTPGPGRFTPSELLYVLQHREDDQLWPRRRHPEIEELMQEAFAWLERVGLIMPDYTQMSGGSTSWRILTRRGRQLRSRDAVTAYAKAAILPAGLVHPSILDRIQPPFLRGDYGPAVFSAFHAVEVAVRGKAGFGAGMFGIKLVREAFKPGQGPLADTTLPDAEQEAESNLFAGAIGAAKNPASHREVEMGQAEAARLILFASHLLAIVDSRGC